MLLVAKLVGDEGSLRGWCAYWVAFLQGRAENARGAPDRIGHHFSFVSTFAAKAYVLSFPLGDAVIGYHTQSLCDNIFQSETAFPVCFTGVTGQGVMDGSDSVSGTREQHFCLAEASSRVAGEST